MLGIFYFLGAIPKSFAETATFYSTSVLPGTNQHIDWWILVFIAVVTFVLMNHLAWCVRKECPHCHSRYFAGLPMFAGYRCLHCGNTFHNCTYGR